MSRSKVEAALLSDKISAKYLNQEVYHLGKKEIHLVTKVFPVTHPILEYTVFIYTQVPGNDKDHCFAGSWESFEKTYRSVSID